MRRIARNAAAALALTLPAAGGLAQGTDTNAPPQTAGMPRSILPPDQMPAEEMPADMPMPPEEMPVRIPLAPAVQTSDLGTLEGPVAGTLDNNNGGLGANAWQASERATIVTMLGIVPASTPSAVERMLVRKVLLTAAPAPPGQANVSFNQLRLTKLLDGGYLQDAADLALAIRAPMNFDIVRTQTDALLLAARDTDACSDITQHRLETADLFWVELRAFCYAVTGDSGPLELTRAVISAQGLADPAFVTLLDGMTSAKPIPPDTIRYPDSIHIEMMARLKLPMTMEIATGAGLSGSLVAAGSPSTPRQVRFAAADKALRAGALPTPVLLDVLDSAAFTPPELDGAAALAPAEPLVNGLARIRAALKIAGTEASRAELVHTAFVIAEREGVLAQVAQAFADQAAAIVPAPDWGNWSDLMIRGLLLADKPDAAQRWFDILDRNTQGMADTVDQLELSLALVAPNARRNTGARRLLDQMANIVHPPPAPMIVQMTVGPDPASPDPAAPDAMPAPSPPPPPSKPPQALLARATLDLGLFDALGELNSPDAQSSVEPLMAEPSPGRRPPPVLMQRIDKAALSDARGEVALSVATAIGQQGARDLAPDAVVRMVRALQTAGIRDAAHALAAEALLLRPRAGAAAVP